MIRFLLAKSKLKSMEALVFQALTDMEINHEEFITNLNKKDKQEKMTENVRNVNEKQENMRLNNVNLKDLKNKLCEKCVQIRTDFLGLYVFLS